MALNKTALKNNLLQLYENCKTGSGITEEEFAQEMADIIDTYVRAANVTVTVTSVQPGTGSAPGTGGLS